MSGHTPWDQIKLTHGQKHLHRSGTCFTGVAEKAVRVGEAKGESIPYRKSPADDSTDLTWHRAAECPFGR